MEELKRKANSNLNKLKDLMIAKEIWLDKLRVCLLPKLFSEMYFWFYA